MPNSAEQLALSIIQRLQAAGHIAYLAGGCVRDRLMGATPKDFDVATSATPVQLLKLFPRSQQVGAAFGVILVREKRDPVQIEVATFRTDGTYSDGRHPDSVRFTTPQYDAQRRDFTCNGLFFDPLANQGAGQLHDFVGGQADIHARILRAIGDPAARFAEDHLRMLRAVRFAARLNFTIDPATHRAMTASQEKISLISRERIGEEVRMMLEHPARRAAIELLAGFPLLFEQLFGFTASLGGPSHLWPTLSALSPDADRPVALAALLADRDKLQGASRVADLRARLLLTNEETDILQWLLNNFQWVHLWDEISRSRLKRLMAHPYWPRLEMLYRADPETQADLPRFDRRTAELRAEGVAPPPFITGGTLLALGASPGPHFKKWLDTLYDRQLENEFPTQQEALAAAKQLLHASH